MSNTVLRDAELEFLLVVSSLFFIILRSSSLARLLERLSSSRLPLKQPRPLQGEPNEGGPTGKSEDCVAMYGGGVGAWYDSNCYLTLPFFVVEFGAPDTAATWMAADDDAVAAV